MSEYKWIYFMVEIIGDLLLSPDAGLLDSWKLRGNQHLLVALGWQLKKKTIFQPPKKGRVYVGGMVNCFDQIKFSDSFAIVMPEP
jgi:hypothetical protein